MQLVALVPHNSRVRSRALVTVCLEFYFLISPLSVFAGFYMYIETSRPRKEGDKARLLSPTFNVAPKNPYGITNPPAYCFGFYYHMYGKHIGKSNR